jgi:hypothetical protein
VGQAVHFPLYASSFLAQSGNITNRVLRQNRPRHRDSCCHLLLGLRLGATEDSGSIIRRTYKHSHKVAWPLDVAHLEPHGEAVSQGLQFLLIGGGLVGGADEVDQWHWGRLSIVVERALLHHRQERVQNGGASLEDLVYEGQLRLGQLACRQAVVLALPQCRDFQWPEQLLRHAELGQQPGEEAQASQSGRQVTHQRRLGRVY